MLPMIVPMIVSLTKNLEEENKNVPNEYIEQDNKRIRKVEKDLS